MRYRVESARPVDVSLLGDWQAAPHNNWRLISSDSAGHQEYNDYNTASRVFERNCSLSRFIWPCRVIDSQGHILRYYNPELDERLPG